MWSQVLDRKSRRGMSALDSAKVIRYGNTLPKWTADTSKISPQNPIIHRANPILQLARKIDGCGADMTRTTGKCTGAGLRTGLTSSCLFDHRRRETDHEPKGQRSMSRRA